VEIMETTTATSVTDTPLAARHREAGAAMGVWFGCQLPSDFGDPRAEQGFAVHTVALVDKNYRCYFSLKGPDRRRYLNAILTGNIKDLAEGRGVVSLFLNPQGRILAEIETHAGPESLFCVSHAMIQETLLEALEKYIIMDDVTLSDETPRYATLGLEGPLAAKIVLETTGMVLGDSGELASLAATVGSIACRVVKRSPGGIAGAEFLVERAEAAALWQILEQATRKLDGGPMGYAALSAQRMAQGTPWFGYDFGDKQIPHEAGLEDSHISYTKGCYTGQEIVERVRSRGQVNRRRVDLLFSGETVPPPGTPFLLEGKEVGYLTRAARNYFPPAVLGMGYVRKEGRTLGTKLETAAGAATVVHFPEALESK
jgi:folate-binding protein YgfZ